MGRCVENNKPISDIFKDQYRYRHRYLEYRIQTIKYLKVGSVFYIFIFISSIGIRQHKIIKKELETKASSHQGQCIPAGCRVTLPKRVLITKSLITMRSIFRKLCVLLFTLCKISTAIFESCGAIYRRICECLVRYKEHLVL